MFHNIKSKQLPDFTVPFNPCVVLLQPIEASQDGEILSKSEFQSVDIGGYLAPFKSNDFSISALQAVGALNTLKSTFMSNTSSMKIADTFENYVVTVQENS